MSKELEELQSHMAFQEHTIGELNDVITDQQKQIDMLRLELLLLKEKIEDLEDGLNSRPLSAADEVPPHY